jgi:type I restriction enzyme R subunit
VSEPDERAYLKAEAKARIHIDRLLDLAGWDVQDYKRISLGARQGVAVREFPLEAGHGRADYLLFVDRRPMGVVEAKREGTPLIGVEWQSDKYTEGLPGNLGAPFRPLPFAYESTGVETRFTNGLDPEPRSRRVLSFHQPDTFAGWLETSSRCTTGTSSPSSAASRACWGRSSARRRTASRIRRSCGG